MYVDPNTHRGTYRPIETGIWLDGHTVADPIDLNFKAGTKLNTNKDILCYWDADIEVETGADEDDPLVVGLNDHFHCAFFWPIPCIFQSSLSKDISFILINYSSLLLLYIQ